MEFKSVKDFVLGNYDSPIPFDVKIGDEHAKVKVGRTGSIMINKYEPEQDFTLEDMTVGSDDRMIEKHIADITRDKLENGECLVATINTNVATIRKINQYTTIVYYIRPTIIFESEDQMRTKVAETVEKLKK